VFVAAWDAALSIARDRLADTLLGRSLAGIARPPIANEAGITHA
jgi:hypothetical protein